MSLVTPGVDESELPLPPQEVATMAATDTAAATRNALLEPLMAVSSQCGLATVLGRRRRIGDGTTGEQA